MSKRQERRRAARDAASKPALDARIAARNAKDRKIAEAILAQLGATGYARGS